MNVITESKFHAWRACVAVTFLDNIVTTEERKWVEDKIKHLPLSNDQRLILIKDLETGVTLEETLKKVTDKRDLAFVVDTFRVLGHVDKSFSPAEKESFKKLEAQVLKGLNLAEISQQVEIMEIESYKGNEAYKTYNKASFFERIYNDFMKFLNP